MSYTKLFSSAIKHNEYSIVRFFMKNTDLFTHEKDTEPSDVILESNLIYSTIIYSLEKGDSKLLMYFINNYQQYQDNDQIFENLSNNELIKQCLQTIVGKNINIDENHRIAIAKIIFNFKDELETQDKGDCDDYKKEILYNKNFIKEIVIQSSVNGFLELYKIIVGKYNIDESELSEKIKLHNKYNKNVFDLNNKIKELQNIPPDDIVMDLHTKRFSQKEFEEFVIGKSLSTAIDIAVDNNYSIRVVSLDNSWIFVESSYAPNRLNVLIQNNVISGLDRWY